jgi:hypothetical protein
MLARPASAVHIVASTVSVEDRRGKPVRAFAEQRNASPALPPQL